MPLFSRMSDLASDPLFDQVDNDNDDPNCDDNEWLQQNLGTRIAHRPFQTSDHSPGFATQEHISCSSFPTPALSCKLSDAVRLQISAVNDISLAVTNPRIEHSTPVLQTRLTPPSEQSSQTIILQETCPEDHSYSNIFTNSSPLLSNPSWTTGILDSSSPSMNDNPNSKFQSLPSPEFSSSHSAGERQQSEWISNSSQRAEQLNQGCLFPSNLELDAKLRFEQSNLLLQRNRICSSLDRRSRFQESRVRHTRSCFPRQCAHLQTLKSQSSSHLQIISSRHPEIENVLADETRSIQGTRGGYEPCPGAENRNVLESIQSVQKANVNSRFDRKTIPLLPNQASRAICRAKRRQGSRPRTSRSCLPKQFGSGLKNHPKNSNSFLNVIVSQSDAAGMYMDAASSIQDVVKYASSFDGDACWITKYPILEASTAKFGVPLAWVRRFRAATADRIPGLVCELDAERDKFVKRKVMNVRNIYYKRMWDTNGLNPASKKLVRGRIHVKLKKLAQEEIPRADTAIKLWFAAECKRQR